MSLSRARAVTLFSQLGVWDTADNSGVLIYILKAEHQLEIQADRGIHAKVGESVWQAIVGDATARFKKGDYEQGLLRAIEAISVQLRRHFPPDTDNPNELPDAPLDTVGSAAKQVWLFRVCRDARYCLCRLRGDRPHCLTEGCQMHKLFSRHLQIIGACLVCALASASVLSANNW